MVRSHQVDDFGVVDHKVGGQRMVDPQERGEAGPVSPGRLQATSRALGPVGDSISQSPGQGLVGGPGGGGVEVAHYERGPGEAPFLQCLLKGADLVPTGPQRGRNIEGVRQVHAPDHQVPVCHQGVAMGEPVAPDLDGALRDQARAVGSFPGLNQPVGIPLRDDPGGGRRQFLEGDDIGPLGVEHRLEMTDVDVAVVQIGRHHSQHQPGMVCEDEPMECEGRLLVATPLIVDPNFVHTVVYVYAHRPDEGAAGVVLNRPTTEPTVEHLPEWRSALAAPPIIFWGGPVATDSGVVLMVQAGEIRVADDLEPPSGPVRARLFVGQAGWGPGQLEAEIAEGAWVLADPEPAEVLGPFPDRLWPDVLRRMGGPRAMWATHPVDPRVN